MPTTAQLSRWVAYFGVVALIGALFMRNPLSAVVAAGLILQAGVYQFYQGYSSA